MLLRAMIFLLFLGSPCLAAPGPLTSLDTYSPGTTRNDQTSAKNFRNLERRWARVYDGTASLEVSSIVSSLETVALLDATSIEADGGVIGSLTATTADINGGTVDGAIIGGAAPAAGSFTTLQRTTPVTHTLVSSRMMWYGAMTVGDFSISEVRSINRAGNKTYAIDIPLSFGQKIINVVVRIVSNQTVGGTFKLQKALYSGTTWTDVESGNITASGTTTITPNYVIEAGYAVRCLIAYTATGGTYSYHYPLSVTWQQTTL